jgi:hypothetical protein
MTAHQGYKQQRLLPRLAGMTVQETRGQQAQKVGLWRHSTVRGWQDGSLELNIVVSIRVH